MSTDSDLLSVKPITCPLKEELHEPLRPLAYPLPLVPTFADYLKEVLKSSQMPLFIATSVADETNKIKKFVQEQLEKQGTPLGRGLIAFTVDTILLESESLKQQWRKIEDSTPGHSLDTSCFNGRIVSLEQDRVVKKDEDKQFMWAKHGDVVKSEQKVAAAGVGSYSDSFKNNMLNAFRQQVKKDMEFDAYAADTIILPQAASIVKFKEQIAKAVEPNILVHSAMTVEEISKAADHFAKLMEPTAVQGKEEVVNSLKEEANIDSTGKTAYYGAVVKSEQKVAAAGCGSYSDSFKNNMLNAFRQQVKKDMESDAYASDTTILPQAASIVTTEEITTESIEEEVPEETTFDSALLSSRASMMSLTKQEKTSILVRYRMDRS